MSENKDENPDITLTELATEMRDGVKAVRQEMREGFKEVGEKISSLESYTHQGFETVNAKIDGVEERVESIERELREVRGDVEELTKGMFTPTEKDEVLAMVRHYDRWLEAEAKGEDHITLTRPEYGHAHRRRASPESVFPAGC